MNHLNEKYFFPEVYQAVAADDYIVYAYMNDGSVRKVNVAPFIKKGGVFEPLADSGLFKTAITVIGYTVAWDIKGNRDERECIDIDPFYVFESPAVSDVPDLLS